MEKLQKTPNQLQAISDLANVLDKINKTLNQQNQSNEIIGVKENKTIDNNEKKSIKRIIKEYYTPICICGSFISLLALLIMKLLGL